ncbi:MAG: hypothetical protein QF824_01925 [Candidatus Woesearchaeota archaeon]|nr:hypothetical protein [Candidatus Woesearchaeota archaeon]
MKNSVFSKTFKSLDRKFLLTILNDIIFFIILILIIGLTYFSIIFFAYQLQETSTLMAKIQTTDITKLNSLQPEAEEALSTFRMITVKIVATLLLALISTYLVATYFKGKIWSIIHKTKLDKKFYKKFLLLRLTWYAIWALIFYAVYMLVNTQTQTSSIIIFSILLLYFTMILLTTFNKEKKIFKTIAQTIKLGIKKFHLLFLPYLINIVILTIIYFIINPFIISYKRPQIIIYTIIVLISIAWLRFYISEIIGKIKNKEKFMV